MFRLDIMQSGANDKKTVFLGLRCPTTSGAMAAKITSAWVSFELILACLVSNVLLLLTLTLCLHRGPLQCREKESGHLLQHSNLQVKTDILGLLLTVQFRKIDYEKTYKNFGTTSLTHLNESGISMLSEEHSCFFKCQV